MNAPNEPPEQIVLTIDEALDLLSHLEDAHESFLDQGLLSGAALYFAVRSLRRLLGDRADLIRLGDGAARSLKLILDAGSPVG